MLKLKNIKKHYLSANDRVDALQGVDLTFRDSEFVSILGPSGCGKTTLLNIIGGLDQYSSGDLIINGKSTKDFKDHDWDSYRNHSIGFVFQSYHLIPHQSVLANVELALTLSGVSKAERRRKACAALEKVGLGDQIKKRPNQLSGGQMQRVAIARALVNDPDILLADEPTGALDSVTSVQIMDLLKEVAKEKLVIMVTHNPDLANSYSTRIIRLLDGKVTDDSNPYTNEQIQISKKKKEKKPSMSLWTAFSLSLNNLMTKKGRTILTSFAGSIGIIGIALILSISNGINAYINSVQEESLSGYPINIQAESQDMSALMTTLMGLEDDEDLQHELDAVYSSKIMHKMINAINGAEVQTNNLQKFKKWLDSNDEMREYASHIQYSYDPEMHVFTKDASGLVVKSNMQEIMNSVMSAMGINSQMLGGTDTSAFSAMGFGSYDLFQEMLPNQNGEGISPLIYDQYDMIHGHWPENENEIVLLVNERNEVSDMVLCALGFKSTESIADEILAAQKGETLNTALESWSYDDLCAKEFKIFLPFELYQKNADGTGYTNLTELEKGADYLYQSDRGTSVRISGIIRLKEDATAGMMSSPIGYTNALTRVFLEKTAESELLLAQKNSPKTDILNGLEFISPDYQEPSDEEKALAFTEYAKTLSEEEKAELYRAIASLPDDAFVQKSIEDSIGQMDRETLIENIILTLSQEEADGVDTSYIRDYVAQMSDEELFSEARRGLAEMIREEYAKNVKEILVNIPSSQLCAMFDMAMLQRPENESSSETVSGTATPSQQSNPMASLPTSFTTSDLASFYDEFMPASYSESNYDNNLKLLGDLDEKSPRAVNIYTSTFDNKDKVGELIDRYNEGVENEDKIEYTDMFAMLMSGIATIINAISYVLIAFVSISLIVSSIMIGIITYISVLERTKEIGILRSVGASKKDVSRVFTAESFIEGLAAGLLGIGITLLLLIPINIVLQQITDISNLAAVLPPSGYLLILVSIFLSYIAGLFPSKMAAKRDPVVALRTE